MSILNPYHEGERAIQALVGETSIADQNARVISNTIISGARSFLAQQTMLVWATVDPHGYPCISLLFGPPGFTTTADGSQVYVALDTSFYSSDDPVILNLHTGAHLGMLAIDLSTRRRLRVNGAVSYKTDERIEVAVVEAYPNCPKYIQRRHARFVWKQATAGQLSCGVVLGAEETEMVRRADTLFIGSVHPDRGVDASHRGGNPGFLHIHDDRTLLIPDYPGNSMFNTLGNLHVNPNAGLVIPDFEQGRLLHLTGTVEIIWTVRNAEYVDTLGTDRAWKFTMHAWQITPIAVEASWEFLDYSPFNPGRTTQIDD